MLSVLVCVICGSEFVKERKAGRKPLACSQACAAEHARRKTKAWYEAHKNLAVLPLSLTPQYKAENWRKQYEKHRQHHIGRSMQYTKDHPEWKQARDAARYALTRGAPTAERFSLDYIFKRDKGVCHLCGKRVSRNTASMDHLIPVALGGPHTRANVALAHRSCNSAKKTIAMNEQLRLLG